MKRYTILFTLFLLFQSLTAQYQSPPIPEISDHQEVRFIVFGDSQFGNPPQFERMIHEANMLRPQFVIQVGDLINGYTHDKEKLNYEWKWFLNQISPLDMPYYPVPGNHDIITDEAEEVYAEIWGEDRYNYSFDYGSVHCISLNSFHGEEDDRIAEWQYDWLKKDLENFKDSNNDSIDSQSIFVFLHSPLWKYSEDSHGKKDWDKVHQLLTQYPVKLVVGGHSHEYLWQERGDINYLIINSAGVRKEIERDGMFSSFLHVSVIPGQEVKYAAVKAGSVLPLDAVTPDERSEIKKYKLADKSLRITDWNVDGEFETTIIVPIENKLDEKRSFNLDWDIPYKSNIKISPESRWVEVDSNSIVEEKFHFTAISELDKNFLPELKISTKNQFRTGYLSREQEEIYRKQTSSDRADKSNIILDKDVIFEATYSLTIPRQTPVAKKKNKIIIDGKVTKKEWKHYTDIGEFHYFDGNSADHQTSVKICYDADYLYIGAIFDEPNPSGMISTAHGEIPFTWNDDDIELFFDTRNNQKDYTRLFQTSHGVRFNSLERWVEDKYFQSEYKSEIQIAKDYWSIEMRIPWKDIGISTAPVPGDQWGFNVSRNRPQSEIKESHWAGNPYNPKAYGVLDFK